VLAGAVHAEEGKWIDGIKFRYGTLRNTIDFSLKEGGGHHVINKNPFLDHLQDDEISPISITLPENLMNSWSFRGALFEYQDTIETNDLVPVPGEIDAEWHLEKDTTYLVQSYHSRTFLKESFFNSDDLSFVNANPNWALSADTVSKQIFLGYYWGVFIPAWDYQRLMKLGWGIGVFYAELSYTLNLCSEYKISLNLRDEGLLPLHMVENVLGKKRLIPHQIKGLDLRRLYILPPGKGSPKIQS
jgi:hypothetical protein